jgi:hypothetical protein
MDTPHIEMATRHFERLARQFPVMCASDEFHFLPRVAAAGKYYERMDDFEAEKINGFISEMEGLQKELSLRISREKDLEIQIDLELLKANVTGFLVEMKEKKSWRFNPLLYLKIAFIGLDHALTKPVSEPGERLDRLAARLGEIPRLLRQAADNITRAPETYYAAALDMLKDCKKFLKETVEGFTAGQPRYLSGLIEKALSALNAFEKFLYSLTPAPNKLFESTSFGSSLKGHFLSIRDLEEVFQIAVQERHDCLDNLRSLQAKLHSKKSWQELYHSYYPVNIEAIPTISLYQREASELKTFFSHHGFGQSTLYAPMEIMETPSYLESVRSSASFAAAFTNNDSEKSFFYITTRLPGRYSSEAETLLKKRLHREYKFLTAHETVPGHHMLDSVRRGLENPIRSQIESPLFYEGWATYAETLLITYGYVNTPIEYLVDYKRRLWRAVRCQIDVGLPTGMLRREAAIDLLVMTGFSPEEARRQIDRFQLNPGYQLCYTLGSYEIKKLVDKFGPKLGEEQCRMYVLTGGELPFHLIEKRLTTLDRNHRKRHSRI